jgi:hypothetical protein
VRTFSSVPPLLSSLHLKNSTGLKVERASWIPKHLRKPATEPPVPRALTPIPPSPKEAETEFASSLDTPKHKDLSAWNPASRLPSEHLESPGLPPRPDGPPPGACHSRRYWSISEFLLTGAWLLDPHLLYRKVDVRIQGTRSPVWRNGRYEGQLGFTVLTEQLHTVESPITVKVGYEEKRITFQAQHLLPEKTTTEPLPEYVRPQTRPRAIVSAVGTQVVIIGPDLNGLLDYIGDYAVVAECKWPLEHDQACMYIASTGPRWGACVYFNVNSLCRSLTDNGRPIQWPGPNQWLIV